MVSRSIYSFKEEPLDSEINFEDVLANRFIMITGKGMMVYWKGCNVTVYEKDSEGNEQIRKLIGVPDGQGVVEYGVKLYVTDGKVKQG
ncbi:hypothetical protein BCON_0099g00230 [Botryotinia convoluta]|uniref:Uncharacterized protein n=1 Tax=Botryotinia convoluta TaxID=54673 RepID=A0A4Z1I060_9HELO|nr:hypothetical protein BCON_0099g00230 [Botryotinia convoluta]